MRLPQKDGYNETQSIAAASTQILGMLQAECKTRIVGGRCCEKVQDAVEMSSS